MGPGSLLHHGRPEPQAGDCNGIFSLLSSLDRAAPSDPPAELLTPCRPPQSALSLGLE